MTQAPPFAVVRMGRGNAASFIVLLGFLTVLVGIAAVSSARSDDSSAKVLGFGTAALLAIPLVVLVVRAPRFLSPASIAYDTYGMHLRLGGRQHSVAWPLIAGVAIGYAYQQPENAHKPLPLTSDGLKDMITDKATGAVMEALQLSDRRQFALELYPSRPDATMMLPGLKPYWTQLPPTAPGLPPFGWRIQLPPVMAIADQVGRATHAAAANRWVGFVPRPWVGKSGK